MFTTQKFIIIKNLAFFIRNHLQFSNKFSLNAIKRYNYIIKYFLIV